MIISSHHVPLWGEVIMTGSRRTSAAEPRLGFGRLAWCTAGNKIVRYQQRQNLRLCVKSSVQALPVLHGILPGPGPCSAPLTTAAT